MDERESRPALREYLMFLALIVVISGAGLWLLGGQTSQILSATSGTI